MSFTVCTKLLNFNLFEDSRRNLHRFRVGSVLNYNTINANLIICLLKTDAVLHNAHLLRTPARCSIFLFVRIYCSQSKNAWQYVACCGSNVRFAAFVSRDASISFCLRLLFSLYFSSRCVWICFPLKRVHLRVFFFCFFLFSQNDLPR